MANGSERKVISYIGDIQDIETKLNKLKHLNATVAESLGADFAKNLSVVGKGYDKLGKTSIKKLPDEMKSLIGTTSETSDVVKTANGEFLKLSKSTTIFGKRLKNNSIQPMARVVTTVNNASESLSKFGKNQSFLIGKSSQLKTNLNSVSSINSKFANSLKSTGNVTEIISKNVVETSGNLTKFGAVVKTSDGRFLQLRETVTKTAGGIQNVQRSVKDVTKSFTPAIKNTENFGQSISRLAKRAALTIPIWFAIRGSISLTTRAFKDSIKAISDQDRALQKAKRNISGSAESVTANYEKLRKEALKLSLETGVSVESIVNSFQKFATVGFDFETSLEGATSAIKTSILLFGDAEETANAFARSLRVLVDRSDSSKSAGEQISEAMALTAELWKTNAFEINEFTQSLEKFAGTAKTTNITTKETIALLSTLSTAGLRQRGGRLLRTSINKLLGNLDELAGTLGVRVNPKLDTTFSVLIKVIDQLEKLQSTTGALGSTTEIIGKIFGGVRGAEVVRALIALRSELNKNIAVTGDLNKFNKEFEEQNKQINRLSEQFKNLNKEGTKAFIGVILGGEDWKDTLKSIVDFQKQLNDRTDVGISRIEALGHSFNFLKDIVLLLPSLLVFLASLGKIKPTNPLGVLFDVEDAKLRNAEKKVDDFFSNLKKAVKNELPKRELEELLTNFRVKIDESNIQLDNKALIQLEADLRKQLQELKSNIESDPSLDIKPKVTVEEQQEVAKLVLDNILAQAKAQGASESQLLRITKIANERFGIEEKTLEKLSREVELEREIANEKRLQSEFGNETVKLFKIAQEHGEKVSQKISDVLSRKVDFSTFIRRGGQAVDIFKKDFADVFEQQQIKQWVRGERVSGLPNLRGGGRVNIQEEFARREPTISISALTNAVNRFAELGTKDITSQSARIQELQVARMKIDLVDLPVGGLNASILGNANLQSVPNTNPRGALTNADLVTPQASRFEINFDAGSFVIHGSPDKATQDAIKKSVTDALTNFKNDLVGRQTKTL